MKREVARLYVGPVLVLVLAALLAVGLSVASAYGGESTVPEAAGFVSSSALSKGAVVGEDPTFAKELPADGLAIGSESSQHAALAYEPLPSMPVTGALDSTHADDYYRWNLAKGQTAYVSMTGDAGTDFDLWLYGPDGLFIGSSEETTYPDGFALTVWGGGAGTYYIRVHRYSGDGAYALMYGVDTDSHLPGTRLPLPGAPVYDMLDCETDWSDCFNVYAFAGQTLSCTLNNPPGADFDLYLYDGSGNRLVDTYYQTGTTNYLSYKAPTSGTYYLVARVWSSTSGSGWYSLSYSRALKTGTFGPVLSINKSRLRVGRTLKYWGTVYPTSFSRNRMVLVQKRKDGRWVQSRWIKLDNYGKFPAMKASYTRRTTQYIRLYMPAYVDTVRGVNYKAGYSQTRKVLWR
jgi:hypothetical protein